MVEAYTVSLRFPFMEDKAMGNEDNGGTRGKHTLQPGKDVGRDGEISDEG